MVFVETILLYALKKKYPNAVKELGGEYFFLGNSFTHDEKMNKLKFRYHIHDIAQSKQNSTAHCKEREY